MKKFAFALMFAIVGLSACKKSSDRNTPQTPTGNYIKMNNDTRQLGDVPSPQITVYQSDTDPDYISLIISMTQKIDNIDNTKSTSLVLFVNLIQAPSANEYSIVNMGNPPAGSATITIALQSNTDGSQMSGNGGKLYVTRDSNNKINSVKFENIVMKGTYEATVSTNIVIK